MMTGCFAISDMRWPTTRAMMSFGPPGGNGTIRRIGLDGNSSAAIAGDERSATITSSLPNILMQAPSCIEQLQRRLVHAGIAGRDDAAAVLRCLAFPVGDDAAGPRDDRDQGGDVVRLELGLDHEVEMAGREHAIRIA